MTNTPESSRVSEAVAATAAAWRTKEAGEVAAADRRSAFLGVQLGVAFGLLAVAGTAIALVWLGAFAFRTGLVSTLTAAGLVLSVLELALLLGQWLLWRRYLRSLPASHDAALTAPVPGRRASWLVHFLSYLGTLGVIIAVVWAMTGISYDMLGFWLLAVAGFGALLGHSFGGVQIVRRSGPAGTLRAHLARFVERSNAKGDAELAALDAEEEARAHEQARP